jgi:hypothetical protein
VARVARIAASASVAGQRAADPADVDRVGMKPRAQPVADLRGRAVRRARNAAADRFADDDEIRYEPPQRRRAARPGADRMRLIDHQQRPGRARQVAQARMKFRRRQHDADVRERGLGQHARDVARAQRALESIEIVELGHLRGHRRVERRTQVTLARDDAVMRVEGDERFIDGAVIAPVEHEDLRPARQRPGKSQHEAVRIGRRRCELP